MKNKSPKPAAKTAGKQTNVSGQVFVPPAYGISFVDRQSNSNDSVIQGKFESSSEKPFSIERNDKNSTPFPSNPRSNNTGLPDNLKTGIENLSGYSMDDVKVHYNSDKPAQLQALAYAQGTNIHVASGQEKHLPHEAWHVVQQKQGRVKPTLQMKGGIDVNNDMGLETEADVMGAKAFALGQDRTAERAFLIHSANSVTGAVQAVWNSSDMKTLLDATLTTQDLGGEDTTFRFKVDRPGHKKKVKGLSFTDYFRYKQVEGLKFHFTVTLAVENVSKPGDPGMKIEYNNPHITVRTDQNASAAANKPGLHRSCNRDSEWLGSDVTIDKTVLPSQEECTQVWTSFETNLKTFFGSVSSFDENKQL